MHHLLDGFVVLEGSRRECLIRRVDILRGLTCAQMSVATGPIWTAEASGAQANPSTEYDNDEREQHARKL
jgi:predicted NUDIX family NTP pyrophosphohydrolase